MTLSPSLLNSDLSRVLADSFPPLARYCPNLNRISPPQAVFLLDEGRESVYGGAARGGKSDALLMAALMYVDVPGYAALILRRQFPELQGADGLLVRALAWLANTDAHRSDEGKLWTFPSGATLRFGHVKDEADKFKYDGQAYQFVGFDELTSFTESQYNHIGFTRMSRPPEMPVPLRTRGSCTPSGVGVLWVKSRFITKRAPHVLLVPAKVWDNPGVDASQYAEGMEHVNEDLRRRLLDGDWDAFEGQSFPSFDESTHCVPAFTVPDGWKRFESLDHGLAAPTVALGWAVDYDGNLIIFDSYYSQRDKEIADHAAAILERRAWWWPQGMSPVCHADHNLWERTGVAHGWEKERTLIDEYREHGVGGFVQAQKNRGAGRARLLDLLRPVDGRPFPAFHPRYGQTGAPRLFLVGERCVDLVEQLKAAPTNEKAVTRYGPGEITDPDWEGAHGHAIAAARYGAMTWAAPTVEKREPDFLAPPDDPTVLKARRMRKVEEKRNKPATRKRYRLT